jgi:hypothetical protein
VPEADVARKTQLDEGLNLLIEVGLLIVLIVDLLSSEHLAFELFNHILEFLGAVLVHFLGALFEAEDEGVLLLLLLLPEVGDGERFGGHVEALELFDIVADVVVGQQDAPVLFVEHE